MNSSSHTLESGWLSCPLRLAVIAIGVFLAISYLYVGIAYAGSVSLYQCENGPLSAPTSCTGNWNNGNLNQQHNHYREGDTIPYKLAFSGLTANQQYSVTIGWDVIHSSKHAIDYLTTWNVTTGGDPCSANFVSTICSNPPTTSSIPTPDPVAPGSSCGVPGATAEPSGNFTLYGGTINSLSPYLLNSCSQLVGSTVQNQITITFTASITGGDAILLWGGHIGRSTEWGAGSSAGGISGSPYHTAVVACGTGLTGCGQQDAQLAASAVGAVTMLTQRRPATAIAKGGIVTDTATLTGSYNGAGNSPLLAPTGSVQFYICYKLTNNPTDLPACNSPSDGQLLGSPVMVGNFSGSTGTATSISPNTTHQGMYCFLAVYSPDTAASIGYTSVTDQISSTNQAAECFFINDPTAVTLTDLTAHRGTDWLPFAMGATGILLLGTLAIIFSRRQA